MWLAVHVENTVVICIPDEVWLSENRKNYYLELISPEFHYVSILDSTTCLLSYCHGCTRTNLFWIPSTLINASYIGYGRKHVNVFIQLIIYIFIQTILQTMVSYINSIQPHQRESKLVLLRWKPGMIKWPMTWLTHCSKPWILSVIHS